MKIQNKIFIIIIAAFSWTSINAQQYPDSLLKYLEMAAKNNPGVVQKFTLYQAALQKIPQAGSLSDPQLDVGVYLSPMELVNGSQAADLRLMQMFPWFGVLRNAKDEMSQMANASFEQFRDAKLQVFYDVIRTWNDLYRIRKNIGISEKNIGILGVIERLALIRYKSAPAGSSGASSVPGMAPGSSGTQPSRGSTGMQSMPGSQPGAAGTRNTPSAQSSGQMQGSSGSMGNTTSGSSLTDIYRIRIESGDLRNNIALLKNQEQTITAQFNSYLDRPPSYPVFTSDTLVADTMELSLASVPDSINANNPMLKMIEYERRSYAARKKMVTGMGYPMVGLGVNYSIMIPGIMATSPEMNGKDMIMPMVSITIPVYRKKYNAMKREADLSGAAALQNYRATQNALQTEYYQALQLYQDSKRRIRLYDEQFRLASRSLDIILRSFSASTSDLTDVLRVRQQTLDYELNKITAVTDFNSSLAWLKRLMSSSKIK